MTGASRTVCKVSGWDNAMHERRCARPPVTSSIKERETA